MRRELVLEQAPVTGLGGKRRAAGRIRSRISDAPRGAQDAHGFAQRFERPARECQHVIEDHDVERVIGKLQRVHVARADGAVREPGLLQARACQHAHPSRGVQSDGRARARAHQAQQGAGAGADVEHIAERARSQRLLQCLAQRRLAGPIALGLRHAPRPVAAGRA